MESGNLFPTLDLLRRHEIPFVVMGGHAVIHHGFVRATEDVHILFIRTIDSEVEGTFCVVAVASQNEDRIRTSTRPTRPGKSSTIVAQPQPRLLWHSAAFEFALGQSLCNYLASESLAETHNRTTTDDAQHSHAAWFGNCGKCRS